MLHIIGGDVDDVAQQTALIGSDLIDGQREARFANVFAKCFRELVELLLRSLGTDHREGSRARRQNAVPPREKERRHIADVIIVEVRNAEMSNALPVDPEHRHAMDYTGSAIEQHGHAGGLYEISRANAFSVRRCRAAADDGQAHIRASSPAY